MATCCLLLQLAYPVLQTTHVLSKHGLGLWIFGLLGRVVELKPHHVLPVRAFMYGSFIGLKAPRAGKRIPLGHTMLTHPMPKSCPRVPSSCSLLGALLLFPAPAHDNQDVTDCWPPKIVPLSPLHSGHIFVRSAEFLYSWKLPPPPFCRPPIGVAQRAHMEDEWVPRGTPPPCRSPPLVVPRGGGGGPSLGQPKITSQRLLDQSQAGVYRGKCHIPPHFGLFGPIRVPYPKGLNC